ncbi:histidine kinase [Brachybacterium sp. YJGR34]|uniref:sensor histidine kinase n=1 Tax=Brachybacterium sp. YJGR34 TaxID=2059911 RepID=UPI000E0B0FA7|nr:histidine kinase [Brachybacterium sp. YJGR34]
MVLVPDRRSLRRLRHDLALVLSGLALTLLAALVLLPLAVLSSALAVLWIGVLLLPLSLTLASGFARWDRDRLRRWGLEVNVPRYRPRGHGVTGMLRLVTDARRWLDLAFEALIALPVRLVTAAVTLLWAAVAVGGLTYWLWGRFLPPQDAPRLPGQWALVLVIGLVMALSLPAMVHALARLDAIVSAPLLGGAVPGGRRDRVRPGGDPVAAGMGLAENAWVRMTVAFLAFVLVVVAWPVTASLYAVPPAVAMVTSIAIAAAALLAVRWPWAGLALSVLAAAGSILATSPAAAGPPWPWPVTALLAHCLTLTVLAVLHRWYWAVSAWSGGALLTGIALLVVEPRTLSEETLRDVTTNGVVLVAISGGTVLLGLTVRQWLIASDQVEQAQTVSAEEVRRRYELEERSRIARELHDVVAHSMSVITVQAGTATFRLPGLDARAAAEFEEIAASSRQALGEMRSLLAVLRTDDSLDEMPMPELADIEELVAASRASGAAITVEIAPVEVPPTVGLTAYRVVQEALANALRHARGAAIDVRLTAEDGTLLVEVSNAAPATAQEPLPGSGLGLAGTRERVAALGGTVDSGPTAEGGFLVSARIPHTDPLPQ